ncbi:hypothetical protein [Actinocorallia populi]|uniref:hypothetical protein n=1 Tax=Actinocorallia populi TaxID=2079200 RepID=UPI000D092E93|nr:hypothetical protein [Actinocorallia populi]
MRWARWAVTAVTCAAIAAGSWAATRPGGPAPVPPPSPAPTVPPLPTASPPSLDGVPESMLGRWRGNAEGPGGTYELDLELTRGALGQPIGESGVGSATCRFSVVLEGAEPDAILFSEKLASGSGCLGSSGRLALHGERLRYSALTEDGDVVMGELRRV